MGIFSGMGGALAGAGLRIGGSIFGGLSAARQARKVRKNLEKQLKENQEWYDRRYNEDSTQRADAQRMLSQVTENIRNRTKQFAGTQAVMGGTDESMASAQAANSSAYGDVAAQIAVNGDRRKDQIENQFMSRKESLNKQINDTRMQQAQATTQAINGVANAAANVAEQF